MTPTTPRPSWDAAPLVPDDIHAAVACCRETVLPALDRDWSVAAGPLDWDCRATLDHIGDALASYVRQLATRSPTQRPRFRNGDPGADIETLLDEIDSLAHVLAVVADGIPGGRPRLPPDGHGRRRGVRGHGLPRDAGPHVGHRPGLDLAMSPPAGLPAKLLNRLFPWAPTGHDAWETVLHCAGRTPLGDLPHQHVHWGWHAAPREEWTGEASPIKFTGNP
jgi:hypothetical protein